MDGWAGPKNDNQIWTDDNFVVSATDFEVLHLPILRDYLNIDFGTDFDTNSILEHFCYISYLIGNDFIPHIIDVVIQVGDFDKVVDAYKKYLEKRLTHIFDIEEDQ
jgi:5'-3' exoribonuclease 1